MEEDRTHTANHAFMANLYFMEMERIKYLLRSYLRTRLTKASQPPAFALDVRRAGAKLGWKLPAICARH